ncbi:MAG: phosphatidate cytidylyltransferase [Peptococcaceae bacterium]|nr:phosphatidate cytidylyltransferase [Peptococcaceae bacterium]
MKTRILTGVVGIPIVLLCIFGPTPLIYLLGFVMMAALNYELANMQGERLERYFLLFAFFNMLVAFGCYVFVTQELGFIFALVNVLVMAETVFSYPKVALSEMMYLAFMNIYCTWLPLHMISLRLLNDGAWLLMSVFIMVWICDSGAYFSGRAFGRHKMAPHLSPKKTIEGAVGGVLLTVAAALVIEQFLPLATSLLHTCVIGLLVAFGAIVGDLFESYLKRSFGVKDSGNILPGHGGFADRFDSFIMVAPLCFYYFSIMQG